MPNEVTGFRSALVYSNVGHRFDGIPLHVVQSVLGRSYGVGTGHVGYSTDFIGEDTGQWTLSHASDGTATTSAQFGMLPFDINSPRYGTLFVVPSNGTRAYAGIQMREPAFRYEVGKKMWFFTRLRMSDPALTSVSFGLSTASASFLISSLRGSSAGATPVDIGQHDDMIMFTKQATQTRWDFVVRKNGVETRSTQIPATAMVGTNLFELGFVVDKVGTFHVWVDSAEYGTANIVTGATVPDDTDLIISFAAGNSTAVQQNIGIDYVVCYQEANLG